MSWLKLIRWPNLLIIFVAQATVWGVVIRQLDRGSDFLLNPVNFLCLSLATILIAAAGYIINDYFDVKIDTINRPDKVVLGKVIPRKQAITMHAVFNGIAILLSAFVAFQAGHPEWLLLQVACIILLWRYSTHFKRQYIIGNVVVSLLTALTVLVLAVYEPAIHRLWGTSVTTGDLGYSTALWLLLGYAYFAFFLTWMREIVKDMEDFIGDAQEGCVTMPIKKGLKYSKRFTLALSVFVLVPLALLLPALWQLSLVLLVAYILLLVLLPLLVWCYYFSRSKNVQDFYNVSRGLKWIMVSGIGTLIVFGIQIWL